MTEDVAALVLRNNDLQTLALSLAERRGLEFSRLPATPDADPGAARPARPHGSSSCPTTPRSRSARRRSQPLTRAPSSRCCSPMPSCRSMTSSWKSSVPDDPYLGRELERYFPRARFSSASPTRRKRHPAAARDHRDPSSPTRSSTAAGLALRCGSRIRPGAPAAKIAAAFAAVRDSYEMTALNAGIDRLDNKVSRQVCNAPSTSRCRTSWVTAWSGSCATWTSRRAWRRSSRHYRQGIAAVESGARAGDGAGGRGRMRGARSRAQASGRARTRWRAPASPICRACSPAPDIVSVADRTQQDIADVAGHLFRRRILLSASTASCGQRPRSMSPTISIGWRSIAPRDGHRGRRAAPDGGHGGYRDAGRGPRLESLGWRRAGRRSIVSACRCRRSPIRVSRSPSSRSRRAC